jgi:ubiquitin carboxyl-terminal hydrolase 7
MMVHEWMIPRADLRAYHAAPRLTVTHDDSTLDISILNESSQLTLGVVVGDQKLDFTGTVSVVFHNADPKINITNAVQMTTSAHSKKEPTPLTCTEILVSRNGWANGGFFKATVAVDGSFSKRVVPIVTGQGTKDKLKLIWTMKPDTEYSAPLTDGFEFTATPSSQHNDFSIKLKFSELPSAVLRLTRDLTITLVDSQPNYTWKASDPSVYMDLGRPITFKFRDVSNPALTGGSGGGVQDGNIKVELLIAVARQSHQSYPHSSTYSTPSYSYVSPQTVTGMCGLQNQGATCYMNSMLQTLFWTPAFRRLVYEMPTTGADDPTKSIPLCLQRLFCRMQLGDKACSTVALTRSFGWDDMETIVQHDVQEFCRVLMDNLETKMKGTPLEGRVASLFRGKARSYVRCPDIGYQTCHDSEFYDLCLVVKGVPDMRASFEKYIEKEQLFGDNQYDTGDFGKHDAEMGTEFLEFPPILQVHLRRFEYDYNYNRLIKLNDRFEFPETIDLADFLSREAVPPASTKFDLYGVLVHSGSAYSGHYYAFLRTSTAADWYKFNDTLVTRASVQEAVNDNFGSSSGSTKTSVYGQTSSGGYNYGHTGYGYSASSWANGYMLVYVRQTDAPVIYQRIDDSQIPQHLRDYFAQGDEQELSRTGAIEISVIDEDGVRQNCSDGKTGFECKALAKSAAFSKDKDTNVVVYQKFSELFGMPVNQMRLWSAYTQYAPYAVFDDDTTSLIYCYHNTLFLQRKPEAESVTMDKKLFTYFVKFYHPTLDRPLQYVGAFPIPKSDPISSLFPRIAERLGFPPTTHFVVYEEVGATARLVQSLTQTTSCYTVGTLILQLEAGVALHPTTYQWVTTPFVQVGDTQGEKDAKKKSEDEATFAGLPIVRASSSSHADIDKFLTGSIDAILFDFDAPDRPVLRISFSTGMTVNEFKRFVAESLKLEFDPHADSYLVYKGDSGDPNTPSIYPISSSHSGEIAYQFSGKQLYRVFARVVRGMPESQLSRLTDLSIQYSEDGYTIAKTFRLYVPWDASLVQIRQQLVDRLALPETGDVRVATLWSHSFEKVVTDMNYRPQHWETVRIDVIPDDQRGPDVHLLQGCFMIQETYLRGIGNPFFFPLKKDEKVPEFAQRLRIALKIGEAEFKKMSLLVSKEKAASTASGVVLKGGKTVEETIASLGPPDRAYPFKLAVIQPSTTRSYYTSRGDESVKIYN